MIDHIDKKNNNMGKPGRKGCVRSTWKAEDRQDDPAGSNSNAPGGESDRACRSIGTATIDWSVPPPSGPPDINTSPQLPPPATASSSNRRPRSSPSAHHEKASTRDPRSRPPPRPARAPKASLARSPPDRSAQPLLFPPSVEFDRSGLAVISFCAVSSSGE
jgi:hypothetical protein